MKQAHLFCFNPLRIIDTSLPAQLLLTARTLAFGLILMGVSPYGRHIPYISFLDMLGSPQQFGFALYCLLIVGYILLLFTYYVRLGSSLIGSAFLISLLGCRPCLSYAHTFVACIFLIISMSSKNSGTLLLRLQVVVLYFGAMLSKLLDADWWNGALFETMMITRHQHALYSYIASNLPHLALSKFMGIVTIFIQIVLITFFLRRNWYSMGLLLGLYFHNSKMFLLNMTFGPFILAVLLSYLAFIEYPKQINIYLGKKHWQNKIAQLLTNFDYNQSVRIVSETIPQDNLKITIGNTPYYGATAFKALLFYNPASIFFLTFAMTVSFDHGLFRNTIMLLFLILVTPTLFHRSILSFKKVTV